MSRDKYYRQINSYNARIFELNDRIYELNSNPQLNISELRKTEKVKSKLIKNKDKLMKKIRELDDEGDIHY